MSSIHSRRTGARLKSQPCHLQEYEAKHMYEELITRIGFFFSKKVKKISLDCAKSSINSSCCSQVAQLNDSDFARALHPGIADVEQEAKKLKAIEQGLVVSIF